MRILLVKVIRLMCRNYLITIILEAELQIKRILKRILKVRRNPKKMILKKSSKQSMPVKKYF